mgnify:CR=1 FL=1
MSFGLQMIKDRPDHPEGYFRLGTNLECIARHTLAEEILDDGIPLARARGEGRLAFLLCDKMLCQMHTRPWRPSEIQRGIDEVTRLISRCRKWAAYYYITDMEATKAMVVRCLGGRTGSAEVPKLVRSLADFGADMQCLRDMQATRHICPICQQRNVKLQACSRCRRAFYCSVACQKQDWKKHKATCAPSPV